MWPVNMKAGTLNSRQTWKLTARKSSDETVDYARPRNGGIQEGGTSSEFFALLTWKYASRHKGVRFFNISTSKSAPRLRCFVHFDFEMCFAPQRRALFQHLNFQKCSEAAVLCTFWLRNVFRATTACTFSTSQLPKVVWAWCALYILTWKRASRHNGV